MADWNGQRIMAPGARAAVLALLVLAPATAAAQGRTGSQTEAQQSLQEADAAQKRGNADEAATLYQKAIQLDPQLVEAYERYSMNLFARKRFAEGVALMRRGLAVQPGNKALQAQLGMHLLKLGKTKEAHGYLKDAVNDFPDRFDIQASVSQCCLTVEDFDCAVAALKNFLTHRPASLSKRDYLIKTMLGTAYLRQGNLKAARALLDEVLRGHPKHVAARLSMAEVLLAAGDCSRAVAAFEAIRAQAASVKGFHLLVGRAYLCNRRFNDALREVTTHLKKEPRAVDGLTLRGDINLQLRRYPAALADYRRAAQLGKREELQIKIAEVYFHQRKYRTALTELEPLAATPGASQKVLVLAIRAAIKSKQKEKALQLGERLLALPEKDAECYYYAGMANASLGKFTEALGLYSKALEAAPTHHGAQREAVKAFCFLARAELREKRPKGALELMRKARKVAPSSLVVNRNLALIHLELGNYQAALKALTPLLKKTPNDFVANRMAGRARLELGQAKKAAAHFERAVASVLRHGGVILARALAESGVTRLFLGQSKEALVELERARELAQGRPETAAFLSQVRQNIARAHVVRAKQAMAAGKQKLAWAEIQRALEASDSMPDHERMMVEAAAAVCALTIGQAAKAQELLQKLKGNVSKVLAAPYNKIGPQLLATYAEYLAPTPGAKQKASNRFAKLAARLPSPGRERLLGLAASAQEQAAVLLFRQGKRPQAKKALARASALVKKAPSAEHRHNMAVLAYVTGERNAAVGTLDAVKGRVPLALCNLAVHYERSGSMERAFQLFQECKRRGAAYPGLDDIVEAKRRIFGGER